MQKQNKIYECPISFTHFSNFFLRICSPETFTVVCLWLVWFVGSGFRDPVMEYPIFQGFSHLAQCRILLYMAAIPPEDKNNSIFSITMNWINLTLSKNDIRVAEWFRALPTLQCPRYTMGSNSPWAFWYFSFQNEFCSNFKGKLLIFANFRKQET